MKLRDLFWYALPSSLVSVQNSIMVRKIIPRQVALQYIHTLNAYDHFFLPWLGFNPVAKGEVAIRQLVLLSIMHYLIKDLRAGDKLKAKANRLMTKALENGTLKPGTEKFEMAKAAFDFDAWVYGTDAFQMRLNYLENNTR